MASDCLYEIFEHLKDEYLEGDVTSLHSCLLVNRLWCEVAVSILWRNIWSFKYDSSKLVGILIACLPNKSKDLLHKNEIFIPTPTSKPPLFNYISFIKILPLFFIDRIVTNTLKAQPIKASQDLYHSKCLIFQELLKAMMSQISSLKTFDCSDYDDFVNLEKVLNIYVPLTYLPNAEDCLTDLSVLSCNSDLGREFFRHLSQICHNIRSLGITFKSEVSSDGLKELISLQSHLNCLRLDFLGSSLDHRDWMDIIPALTKHSNTLTNLCIIIDADWPLSFIGSLMNLRGFFFQLGSIESSCELQHVTLSNLQVLKMPLRCPKQEILMKFLEINGKNLYKLDIGDMDESLCLLIISFCPNLKEFFISIEENELDVFRTIFNSCRHLESMELLCDGDMKGTLDDIIKYSSEGFYELKLNETDFRTLSPEDLESFLTSWNQKSRKSLSFIVIKLHISPFTLCEENEEIEKNIQIIQEYQRLNIIKKFALEHDGVYDHPFNYKRYMVGTDELGKIYV